MCLAIPGRVARIDVNDGIRSGRIQFGGITRQACLDFGTEAKEGAVPRAKSAPPLSIPEDSAIILAWRKFATAWRCAKPLM